MMVGSSKRRRKRNQLVIRGKNLLSVDAISKKYKFHPNTIRTWVNKDDLRHIRRGPGRKIYIRQDDVEQFVREWYER